MFTFFLSRYLCQVFVCFPFICNKVFHICIQEFQPAGEYNLAGVHLGGMEDTRALEKVRQYKLYICTVHLGDMEDTRALGKVIQYKLYICTLHLWA